MKRMTIAGQHGSLQYTYKTSAAGWKSVIISIAFNHDDDYDLYGIKWILGWRMITSTNIDQGYHSFLEVVLMRDTVWNHLDLKDPSTSWQLCLYLSYLQFREPSSTQSVTHSVREKNSFCEGTLLEFCSQSWQKLRILGTWCAQSHSIVSCQQKYTFSK